jgi:hypothetical protein
MLPVSSGPKVITLGEPTLSLVHSLNVYRQSVLLLFIAYYFSQTILGFLVDTRLQATAETMVTIDSW